MRRTIASPPTYKPWPICILAVDPGENCGVCLMADGVLVESCHGDGYDPDWIRDQQHKAVMSANAVNRPLVLVVELPPFGGAGYRAYKGFRKRNAYGSGSVFGSGKLWRSMWEKRADTINRRIVLVEPETWRGPLGIKYVGADQRASTEMRMAGPEVTSPDEAAARLIARWASRAPEIAKVLPKKLTGVAS